MRLKDLGADLTLGSVRLPCWDPEVFCSGDACGRLWRGDRLSSLGAVPVAKGRRPWLRGGRGSW